MAAYATVDELAGALRIAVTPANTAGLQSCLDAAALEIDDAVDRRLDAGAVPAVAYLFSTATTAADPGPGYLRMDKTQASAVKHLYVDQVDADGVTLPWVDVTTNDVIVVSDPAASGQWQRFDLTAPTVDKTGWYDLPVNRTDVSAVAPTFLNGARVTVIGLRPTVLGTQQLALAKRVNILRGVEWWKANDAAWGILGFADTGALRLPRATFVRHAATLLPLKQQWGLA